MTNRSPNNGKDPSSGKQATVCKIFIIIFSTEHHNKKIIIMRILRIAQNFKKKSFHFQFGSIISNQQHGFLAL